jgi:hypothetical protein
MQSLFQNLRFSLRMLWKSPGLTLTVLLTLALGIGANTAIFTVDYATLLAPLPYPQPNQLVMVWSKIQTFHNGVSREISQTGSNKAHHSRISMPGPAATSILRPKTSPNSSRAHGPHPASTQ